MSDDIGNVLVALSQADRAVRALLFEPQGTVNTGDAGGAMTAELRELP